MHVATIRHTRLALATAALIIALQSLPGATVSANDRFQTEVAPLLAKRCLSCHAGNDARGKLDLTRAETAQRGGESGPALAPRQPAESLLWQRVMADEMPPKHPLTPAEKELLTRWIADGAEFTGVINPLQYSSDERAGYDWWSLQPLQRPAVPETPGSDCQNPVDCFVTSKLHAANLVPNAPAEPRVLIRRLWFDLLGLPPTPEDVEAFLADPSADAYERLVDRALASPHYGERWARHWLDVVRFGESNGFERDLPRPHAWHYRDWVIAALNRDMPYDEFVRWQLAGDVFSQDDVTASAALGFLVAGPHDTVVPVVDRMRQQMRQDELEDIVGVVGQTFLGLTVNCARCHDHKFDPVSSVEYYQLAAALSGVDHGERDIVPATVQSTLDTLKHRMEEVERRLRDQAEPVQRALLEADHDPATSTAKPAIVLPTPLAEWDFTRTLRDLRGELHGTLHGSAKLTGSGVEFDGSSYLSTPPLTQTLVEKTLEVRVKLADLEQRGGGAITVQTLGGDVFDGIVFAEQESRRWLAGSNHFNRTSPFKGPEETSADEFITFTVVYRADGTVAGYRNGKPYGRSYVSKGPATFEAGKSQVVFGVRHGSPVGNRCLKGVISAGRVYPAALSDDEVAASASNTRTAITEADILAALTTDQKTERQRLSAELAELRRRHDELSKSGPVKMYTAVTTQPGAARVLRRGNVADPGDIVAPAGLSAIATLPATFDLPPDAPEHRRRERLAVWITDRRNPLFTRVMANRLWHYHFGTGLIETPNDLGFHGGRPSHPELLDWLACELIDCGYSLKQMHRLLVTSATYRRASTFQPAAARVDANNRWLWRMNPRRLDAECVRDAMLMAAGELNPSLGGKGYSDFNSYFFKGTQFYDPIDPVGPESHRRTVYRMWARGGRNPFLDTFDCPDPSTTTPRRSSTTTPLQSLSLMNHAFVLRMSDRLAERVQREAGNDPQTQVRRLYAVLFGRPPVDDELSEVQQFVVRRGLSSACRGLLNTSEFLYVD